ncbi:MAG TPA: pectate lyase [Longimicrobiales bacterium]|nr:pectate lyase [Longimicrobiales bacterium]
MRTRVPAVRGMLTVMALCVVWTTQLPAQAASGPARVTWSNVLSQAPAWYGTDEAVRIADNVLLYQHPNGGWDKNIDMAAVLDEAARADLVARRSQWQTTIDNGATYEQVRYLARVYEATGHERFRDAALRGVELLLEAQYDNGGWPQYYPLRDGYWSRITFNDNAMINVMRLLRDVSRGEASFGFASEEMRARAAAAVQKGIDVILRAQIVVDGVLTAWCAQHDEFDLSPAAARAYEHPSLSGSESVGIIRFLMEIENPSPEVVRAIQSAVAWFDSVRIPGIRVEVVRNDSLPGGTDRVVVEDPNAPPMWARFYEIGTNRPIFSGRDSIIRYSLAEIEHERRVGYSWLGHYAADLLARDYPAWQARWAPGDNVLAER